MSDSWITIAGEHLTAAINPHGAELSSLRDAGGRELMTDADPAYWTGHAPLLFPIVGALNGGVYRLDGKEYAMAQHGFARRRHFTLVDRQVDRVHLRLTDDETTRILYPFAFALDAEYRIEGASLVMEISITNKGETEMPASFGFHPAFAWPLPYGQPGKAHRILFDSDEPDTLCQLESGLISSQGRASPIEGRALPLANDLFADDALIWRAARSRGCVYGAPEGPSLRFAWSEMPSLGIWTKPGARYICIEPWDGLADPTGFSGEIWDKPGIRRIAPGESRSYSMSVALLP